MNILAIDSASRHRVMWAVVTEGGVLIDGESQAGGTVSGSLVAAVGRRIAGVELGAVAVVTGPGSFTGLRSGMAVGLGVAHARGLPLHGISTFAVGAAAAATAGGAGALGPLEVVCDAGRGFVYTAVVDAAGDSLALVTPPRRERLAAWSAGEQPAVSLDEPVALASSIAWLNRPLDGLARAAALAVRGAPLAREGLAPMYVDQAVETPSPRVS